jgi:hypothetical protein
MAPSPFPQPSIPSPFDRMIIETLITTTNCDGTVNIAPMGAVWNGVDDRFRLHPFKSSTTCANLTRTKCGVLHVTDDVHLIAQAVIGKIEPTPELRPTDAIQGAIIASACRWCAFRVTGFDDTRDKTTFDGEIVERGRIRDFLGLNRAKHAVVEAAILASRVAFLPVEEIEKQMKSLALLVRKTAGPDERRAFELLESFVNARTKRQAVSGSRMSADNGPLRTID